MVRKSNLGGFNAPAGTQFTGGFVKQYNEEQLEIRQSLPTFFEALELAQQGNKDIIDLFFYYKTKFSSHIYLDGDNSRRVTSVIYELNFMNKGLHYFLLSLKKMYCDNKGIVQRDSTNDIKFKSVVKSSKFDDDEIESLFNDYLKKFVTKHDLSRFKGESLTHSNNRLIKYIKTDFNNNVLKVLYNERMGVERVQVNKKQYIVKNHQEEVFFEDTVCRKNEDEEVKTLLEVFSADNLLPKEYTYTDESEFLHNNYKNVFTKNQLEKFNKIVEWCAVEGNSVEELFQKNNPSELSKSALSKILFPDRKTTSTMKDIENLFKSMKSRVNKAMGIEGVDSPVKTYIPSSNNQLPDSFSAEEQKLFKKYNLEKYIIGVSQSKLPEHQMYSSVKTYNREPFITYEDYELLLQGKISVQYIIDKYKISKREMNAKNGKVITYVMVDEAEDYDLVITQDEVDRLMESHAMVMLERIKKGTIYFNFDSESNMMVANTYQLNPIPVGLTDTLNTIAPSKNVNILTQYYNTDVLHTQQKFMKIVDKKRVEVKETKLYISPAELAIIRKEGE